MVTDPDFYDGVVRLAEAADVRAEDLLFCWSEATLLEPRAAGPVRTFAGLGRAQTLGWTMPEAIWEKLPSISACDQIPYVEAAVIDPATRVLGRGPSSAFEVCLAHAAPGLLRPDGDYAMETPLHAGPDYPDHWPLDEFPLVWDLYISEGARLSPRQTFGAKRAEAKARGVKGYVSLGDLSAFCKREDAGREAVLQEALRLLSQARNRLGLSELGAKPYRPDLDAAFRQDAPMEKRALSPDEAQVACPSGKKGWIVPLRAKWVFAAGLGLAILPLSLHLHARTHAR